MISDSFPQLRLLTGFDDPACTPALWNELLDQSPTRAPFLTWEYQSAWWNSFGRGHLLLILLSCRNRPIALAPLFADAGEIYFVGSGGSDYLDFIGHLPDAESLQRVLAFALENATGCTGFVFYHMPETSRNAALLRQAASLLNAELTDEGLMEAPQLVLSGGAAEEAAGKTSLRRHERWFQKSGALTVEHSSRGHEIQPLLDEFFNQHRERWAGTGWPSLFEDIRQRSFYRALTANAAESGWLRFTRVMWDKRMIAAHYGFSLHQSFIWYKPSFAIDLAHRSPGEVLLRHLLLEAAGEGASVFDFGLGTEPFKARFTSSHLKINSWRLQLDPSNRELNFPRPELGESPTPS